MKATIFVIPALVLSFQGAVAAQQTATPEPGATQQETPPPTPHQEEVTREVTSENFNELDQDGDGSISKEEAQAESTLSDNWSELDQNGDGMLDSEEFARLEHSTAAGEQVAGAGAHGEMEEGMPTTRHQEQVVDEELIGHLDKDGDGMISQQEADAEAQLADNWEQLDENGDGMLDSRELDQLEQKLSEIEEAE